MTAGYTTLKTGFSTDTGEPKTTLSSPRDHSSRSMHRAKVPQRKSPSINDSSSLQHTVFVGVPNRERERERGGERQRQTDRQRQRQRDRDRETERQTGTDRQRQRDRQGQTETERQTDRLERERERDRQTDRQRQRETETETQTDRQTEATHCFILRENTLSSPPVTDLLGDVLAVRVVNADGAVLQVRVQVVQREAPVLLTVGQLQFPPPEVRHLPHPYHQLPG